MRSKINLTPKIDSKLDQKLTKNEISQILQHIQPKKYLIQPI